jgi:hypothetical protein
MEEKKTILRRIIEDLLGHKYYVNIVALTGTDRIEVSSNIWTTRKAAKAHRETIEQTASFTFIETVTFRSRNIYTDRSLKQGV